MEERTTASMLQEEDVFSSKKREETITIDCEAAADTDTSRRVEDPEQDEESHHTSLLLHEKPKQKQQQQKDTSSAALYEILELQRKEIESLRNSVTMLTRIQKNNEPSSFRTFGVVKNESDDDDDDDAVVVGDNNNNSDDDDDVETNNKPPSLHLLQKSKSLNFQVGRNNKNPTSILKKRLVRFDDSGGTTVSMAGGEEEEWDGDYNTSLNSAISAPPRLGSKEYQKINRLPSQQKGLDAKSLSFSLRVKDIFEIASEEEDEPMTAYNEGNNNNNDDNSKRNIQRRRSTHLYDDEDLGIEVPLLPEDTNSFIAFAKWKSPTLWIAVAVVTIQLVTLTLVLLDIFSLGTSDNRLNIPPCVSWTTSAVQVIALLIIVIGQADIHDSLNTLYTGFFKENLRNEFKADVTYWRWMLSSLVRMFVAIVGLMTTFFMIVSEDDTTQLLLDFASIEFITNIDNLVFWLGAWGYLGVKVQHSAAKICNAKNPFIISRNTDAERGPETFGRFGDSMDPADGENKKYFKKGKKNLFGETDFQLSVAYHGDGSNAEFMPYAATGPGGERKIPKRAARCLFIVTIFLIMFMGWGVILYRQRSGYYLCRTVHVQFNDDFSPKLAAFSGLYDYCDGRSHKCLTGHYQERGHGNYANTAQLGYCKSERAWTFSHLSSPSDEHDICQWSAKSGKIDPYEGEAFDIMGSADLPWSTINDAGTTVPLPTFSLQCFDCKHDADFCGGVEHGECINNRCVCKDGWYGIRCEFPEPCDELEIDPLYPSFQGSTEYAETFQRMKMDNALMSEISVYNRPAYLGSSQGGFLDMIFYNGRRWAMISGASSRTSQGMGKEEMIKMAKGFHGYWSDYKVSFLSEPVDIDTPEDAVSPVGLAWFPVQTLEQERGVDQFPDLKRSIDTRLLCTTCTNETSQNPCLFQGICGEDGRCECTTGSTGRLCQIQPVGNGLCNPYFNTPEFGYDGGDCCRETCVGGEHICGKGVIGDEFGVEAYGYVGYKDCLDPTVTKVSGSQTLHTILNRGYLKCGSSYRTAALNDFHTQLCGALAAAIFGGARSMEMVDSSAGNHFVSILDGEHDVQFGYDLTASSDIFEVSSGSPFSFVAMSNFYGGLLFAGIPPFGLCADRGDHSSSECQGMKICVLGNSTWYNVSAGIFPEEILVGVLTQDDAILGIETGPCNVIAGHQSEIDEQSIREAGFTGTEYEMGSTLHTKSFETLLISGEDRVWSKFVSWVFEALVGAEESGITTETADQMAVTEVFGEQFKNMFIDAVRANGNYGEIWNKSMVLSRVGLNTVNDGSTGLLLSSPFGNVKNQGPPPREGGTIDRILTRGYLKVGLEKTTKSFVSFFNDIGEGISAALFKGQVKVEVVSVSSLNRFTALAGGAVDIVVGPTRNLAREMKEPVTGEAFDFTEPVYYNGMTFSGPMPYGGCADDLQFSDNDCRNTVICVAEGTTWLEVMRNRLSIPEENILATLDWAESISKLFSGECNAIAHETYEFENIPEDMHPFHNGTKKHTKEPLAVMSRSDDSQFSDLLRWIVYGIIYAEEEGITAETSDQMPLTNLFGGDLTGIWQDSIKAVGNYGNIYERNLGGYLPRTSPNTLNDRSSPQLYANPGTVQVV